jgi:hypothetical protein
MQFIIPSNNVLIERREIYVEHKGKELAFSIRPFTRSVFEAGNERSAIFDHINKYIASMSGDSQDKIFAIYENIINIFDTVPDLEETKQKLIKEVKELYKYFQYDDVANWMKYNSRDIVLPSTKHIRTVYNEADDRNHTKDKTYILSDYVDLIAMIVQLRPMIPIWGEYIKNYAGAIGTTFKEFSAYELLIGSGVLESRAMEKLETYVRVVTPKEGNNEAIVEFISSEDYPVWNLALLLVRKVCLFDVRGLVDDSPILIRHISTHIREKIRHSSNSFSGQIRSKTDPNDTNQSEENQTSKFETIKTKEITSAGDRVFIERMVSNPVKLALQLDPECPKELPQFFLNCLKDTSIPLSQLSEVQNILTKQICAPIIPHRGLDYLDSEKLNCVAAAQAVMWNNGFHLIAGILSANGVSDTKPDSINTSIESRTKVRPELRDRLLELFPFTRKSKSGKESDVVMDNVDYIVKELSNEMWILRLPAEMISIINTAQPNRVKLMIPPNIKNMVIELAIYLASRKIDSLQKP